MATLLKNKKSLFHRILFSIVLIIFIFVFFIFPIKKASADIPVNDAVVVLLGTTNAALAGVNINLGTVNSNLGTLNSSVNTTGNNIKTAIETASNDQKKRDEKKALTLAERWAQLDLWEELINIAKVAGIALLNSLLQELTNQIIAWINGGESPKFISNWEEFLMNAADKAGGKFVEENLGLGILCEPFDFQIKVALSTNPPFGETAKCTVSDIVGNVNNFYNNFEEGGWDAFVRISQPQNNIYGAYLLAEEEKSTRMEAQAKAAQNEGLASGGFLGAKDGDGNIKTPGSVLSYEANKAVDSSRQLIQDSIANLIGNQEWPYDQISVALTAIANTLLNKVIKTGLGAVGVSSQ